MGRSASERPFLLWSCRSEKDEIGEQPPPPGSNERPLNLDDAEQIRAKRREAGAQERKELDSLRFILSTPERCSRPAPDRAIPGILVDRFHETDHIGSSFRD